MLTVFKRKVSYFSRNFLVFSLFTMRCRDGCIQLAAVPARLVRISAGVPYVFSEGSNYYDAAKTHNRSHF